MQAFESKYWQEGIDSKALLVCFLQKLPYLLLMGVTGAVLGSGLYLLIAVMTSEGTKYQAETEYYIDFAEGRIDAKDYYNDFTWNDVMATDLILGNTMELLGDSFERNTVKQMITADIISDVRYLTITVEGEDSEAVERISEATRVSLENFGKRMEEFDSISQIENNGIQKKEEPLFTWRACVLGALIGVLVGAFGIAFDFCMGSRFYTKQAVSQCLGIPVFGLLYARGNEADGVQERALQLALQYQMKKAEQKKLVIVNGALGNCAQKCHDELTSLYSKEQLGTELEVQDIPVTCREDFERMRQAGGVLLAVPFGKSCRESVIEQMNQLENQDCKVLGAVLVDVDKKWMKLYGGK